MRYSIFVLLLYASTSMCQQQSVSAGLPTVVNTITTAVPFVIIPTDPRGTGTGEAGLGLSPDANSIYWNTASLGFSEGIEGEISTTYSPWLLRLVSGMHLAQVSGFGVMGQGKHVLGGSAKYFNLGTITYVDPEGNLIGEHNPYEFEVQVAYAFRASERSSLGINGKYIHSELLGPLQFPGKTQAGKSVAVDLSYAYQSATFDFFNQPLHWKWGVTLSNLGNKMSYVEGYAADFIPANLRLGGAITANLFQESHALTVLVNLNKLLVPTPPQIQNGAIVSGLDPNVSAAQGWIQSFYDAPGNTSVNASGLTVVEENSRANEEFNEIYWSMGMEYGIKNLVFLRSGFFYEHMSKGNRRHFSVGLGLNLYNIKIDGSLLLTTTQNNSLSNTLRFGASYTFKSRGEKAESPVVN